MAVVSQSLRSAALKRGGTVLPMYADSISFFMYPVQRLSPLSCLREINSPVDEPCLNKNDRRKRVNGVYEISTIQPI